MSKDQDEADREAKRSIEKWGAQRKAQYEFLQKQLEVAPDCYEVEVTLP